MIAQHQVRHGSMTWQLFTTVGLNQRLILELLHPVQYPMYCTEYETLDYASFKQIGYCTGYESLDHASFKQIDSPYVPFKVTNNKII